jgi:hypothetical protein
MAFVKGRNTTKGRYYAVNLRTGNVEHDSADRAEVQRYVRNAALFGAQHRIVGPGETL